MKQKSEGIYVVCKWCGQTFLDGTHLKSHIKKYHKKICPYCLNYILEDCLTSKYFTKHLEDEKKKELKKLKNLRKQQEKTKRKICFSRTSVVKKCPYCGEQLSKDYNSHIQAERAAVVKEYMAKNKEFLDEQCKDRKEKLFVNSSLIKSLLRWENSHTKKTPIKYLTTKTKMLSYILHSLNEENGLLNLQRKFIVEYFKDKENDSEITAEQLNDAYIQAGGKGKITAGTLRLLSNFMNPEDLCVKIETEKQHNVKHRKNNVENNDRKERRTSKEKYKDRQDYFTATVADIIGTDTNYANKGDWRFRDNSGQFGSTPLYDDYDN